MQSKHITYHTISLLFSVNPDIRRVAVLFGTTVAVAIKIMKRSGFKSFHRAQDQGGEKAFNRRNTSGISRIKRFSPTRILGPRGGFETTSR
jgi:hypothetical protein